MYKKFHHRCWQQTMGDLLGYEPVRLMEVKELDTAKLSGHVEKAKEHVSAY